MTARTSTTPDAVVVIGNFDGVHRGHRALLELALERGRASGWPTAVLTFDPHPAAVLGRAAPPLLTTLARRAELVRELGAQLLVQHFDRELASWSPERFVKELLVDRLGTRVVVVGEDFRFGAQRAGDIPLLRRLGAQHGFEVVAGELAGDEHGRFSSTRVREALAQGLLEDVRHVLGRPHDFSGVVERGQQLGRTLGFPTANLGGIPEVTPGDGIYAVTVEELVEERALPVGDGAMSIGMRPTIEGATGRTHEVFVLDFDGDLYGRRLRVHVVARLRDELKLDGLEALQRQMHEDVKDARAALALWRRAGSAR